MKFFFDNNLSPYIARALHCLNEPHNRLVTALRDKFDPSTPDIDWIQILAAETGWIVFTGDYDIARKGAIKTVWKKAGLVGFVLRRGWQSFDPMGQAWRLIKQWPSIIRQCELAAPGSTYELGIRGGKITTL